MPGRPSVGDELSRKYRKRNDATRSTATLLSPEPWAFAQYDDPIYGSWGVAIDTRGAELYRYDGATWQSAGHATWNASRGRLDGATAPADVLDGLNRETLASPKALEALRGYLKTVIPTSFTGTSPTLPRLAGGADATFRAVARARCASEKATKSRAGTKAALEAAQVRDHDLAVARYALREVCGVGKRPIGRGTPCDEALDALRVVGPDAPCSIEAPPCPHRVGAGLFRAWRSGSMPLLGPYETDKPHAMGADPCCYYHPNTQARMKLRREVEKTLRADVEIGSPTWAAAVRAAELESPLVSVWYRCDEAMKRRVDALKEVTGQGIGGAGAFVLLQAFYNATMRGNYEAQADAYSRLREELGDLPDLAELAELDSSYWDLAIQEARDSGNLGYKRWVQTHGGKSGRTIFKRFDRASGVIR